MLTENDVVIGMCAWLESNGYEIASFRLNNQPGNDVEATKDGKTLYVECKGGRSRRTGHPFGIDYQWRAASGAFFNQVRLRGKLQEAEVGIALPNGGRYPDLMADVKTFCSQFGIRIFLLSEAAEVHEL